MALLDRKNWTKAQFKTLSTDEQNAWIAWEYQRQQQIANALNEAYKPDENGKLYAETVTARLLHIALVTSGGFGGG